jgi:hypothetical protein
MDWVANLVPIRFKEAQGEADQATKRDIDDLRRDMDHDA